MRILLVEDDKSMVGVLTKLLLQHNYVVDVANDGEVGWHFVDSLQYDLILLDVMLPKLDGISFCRRLREQKNQVLVMLLTARDTTTDKLIGLDSGADDYVVKPFNLQEFAARIRALIRRGSTYASHILTCGDLCLDTSIHDITYQGKILRCSRKEYLLLELFLRNQKRVYSCQEIIDHLWTFDAEPPNDSTVRSHIKNIRRELKSLGADGLLETVYGRGYRINPAFISATNKPIVINKAKAEKLDVSVAEIWQQTKGLSLERLIILEQFIQTWKTGIFDDTLYKKAIHNAHKLTGSLGMFGFDAGSAIARKIEVILTLELQPLWESQPTDVQKLVEQIELLVIKLRQELEEPTEKPDNLSISTTAFPKSAVLNSRILLVDNDLQVYTTIKTSLEPYGIQIIYLENCGHFWQTVRASHPNFLILDVSRQIADGLALCRAIRQNPDWNWLPVLFLTASDDLATRQQIFAIGADDYITKPIVLEEISTRIFNRLERILVLKTKIRCEMQRMNLI